MGNRADNRKSRPRDGFKIAAYGLATALIAATQVSHAENWYDLTEDPRGTTRQLPQQIETYPLGNATEKHYPPNLKFNLWVQDETQFKPKGEDRVEIEKVLEKEIDTIKLKDAIPPIGFRSGEIDIPETYIEQLRTVLGEMNNRQNVRLHFIGHSDTDKLGPALRAQYVDNVGLSRYRAQVTAEYFQRQLDLPPDAVSFDGVGASQPIDTNDTEAGKRRNRRVEVQVWYDEVNEKVVEKEVIIPAEKVRRIKVCRAETVCKLTYKDGNARRVRLQNLVKPYRIETGQSGIPTEFIRQIRETLRNLNDKRNVEIRFVGHTDDLPLEAAEKRIYGDHENLSKARSRYVMLEIQDRLSLPNAAVSSSGKGSRFPVASNNSDRGRALNRRVEAEFWYDDPFSDYTGGEQTCPEEEAAETITRVYDPPSGPIRAIPYENGNPVIRTGYTERLAHLMQELEDKANVRLSFIGYTANKRLDRRTAGVYGDDIGLSRSRARRAMELVQKELELTDKQVEYDGRGFVHSDDVISTGFIQLEGSRVQVHVMYDELAVLEDQENLLIEKIERDTTARNPYGINQMRITVDGDPLFDPGRHSEDLQRCTDVALDAAKIQFNFNRLQLKPRLNITAWPNTIRYRDIEETESEENRVVFKTYTNYGNFIDRAEVRLFEFGQPLRSEPLAVLPVDQNNRASWKAEYENVDGAVRRLVYLLRVYDDQGKYDETTALPLWVVDELDVNTNNSARESNQETVDEESLLLAGYGENHLASRRIELYGGTITVVGKNIPEDHNVWLAGKRVPVNENGEFVIEEVFPRGLHAIEVAVTDAEGNGELYLRDLGFADSDWFYVALGELTLTYDNTSGPARLVTQDDNEFNNDTNLNGRFVYYTEGRFGDEWRLISSADTQEGPVDELFSNFLDKDPRALFRRLDPDLYYPTFADDSTLEDRAPTSGKLYLKLQRHNDFGLFGNFTIDYLDTSLAQVDRGLYGANVHFEEDDYTSFGEQRFMVDVFVADPGTVAGRDEFRGTGGSLYFLRRQDVLIGSERLRMEVRDKESGIVLSAKNLVPVIDYDFDYLQGRVLLSNPLSSLADDGLLTSESSLSGNPVYLVARYEYTPGFDVPDLLSIGARTHYWIDDHVKLGATLSSQEQDLEDDELQGIDITYRKSVDSWVRFETSATEGTGEDTLNSLDGGFSFDELAANRDPDAKSNAYRLEGSMLINDVVSAGKGRANFYLQESDAGFSAPGHLTETNLSLFGTQYTTDLNEQWGLDVKVDSRDQDLGLKTESIDASTSYQATDNWRFSGGGRFDTREDNSVIVPATQKEGDRFDLAAEAFYDSKTNWTAYTFAQATASKDDIRDDNHRIGSGGSYRYSDRLNLNGELSAGSLGSGIKAGTEYLVSDLTNVYSAYTAETRRSDNGLRSRQGNWNTGMNSRISDSVSVYGEERYSHGDVPTGLTHAFGVGYAANEVWNFGASVEAGTLEDNITGAETERTAFGVNAAYNFGATILGTALEYRQDDSENPDTTTAERETWLMKNNLKYQIDPDWRFIGKANFSKSTSSQGDLFNGDFTEIVLGYGYRPVTHDRLNTLLKYTYFYNIPFGDPIFDSSTGQITGSSLPSTFIQKSQILSLDLVYDLTARWGLGAKYAHREGEVALDREDTDFIRSRADLYILRADWHFINRWDALLEARLLDLPDAEDSRSGFLFGIYRHVGENIKFGAGYNFTDFSDDLTDLDFDSYGFFINVIAKF
ncbi:MAG: OmpA family protein [Gammaproteobacteria bacterium]|nr:OmpA family protein [Gammaproteobacteria bacterium]